jgi:hypothetical protein
VAFSSIHFSRSNDVKKQAGFSRKVDFSCTKRKQLQALAKAFHKLRHEVDDLPAPVSYVGKGAYKQFVAKFSFAGLKKSYIHGGEFGIMPNFDQKF